MHFVAFLVITLVGAARGFAAPLGAKMPPARAHAPADATSTSGARAGQPTMVGPLGALAALPTLYGLMSVNEYATHRWYQHEEFNRDHAFQRFCQRVAAFVSKRPIFLKDGRRNMIKIKGGGHVEHHAETYDDMSLKKDPRWRRTPAAASLDSDQ